MVEKDNEYILNIEALGYEGEGIAKIDGYPVFISGALIGEKVKVNIIKVKKNFAYGKLIEILEESPQRREPKCSSYNMCGGCTLQHLSYEGQLDYKFSRVKDCIRKIGGLDESIVNYPIGMDGVYRYRNKVQFPVGLVNGKLSIGFFSEKSHEIIDMDICLLQDEESERIVSIIRNWMNEYSIMPAKKDGKLFKNGIVRHIVIRKAFKTDEVMVILVTTNKKIPYVNELINRLNSNNNSIKSIVQNINDKDTNLVMGEKCITLWGSDYICDYIGEYKFNISPLSFFQVNPVQTEVLYNKALEYAELKENDTVFDIYCGIGSISLFLAQKATKVYGIEIVEDAIKDAKINAKLNNLNNVEFYVGKAEEVVPKMYSEGKTANVVVVDPPRKGCDEKVLDTIVSMKPDRVVYVSCNPSTLARDLAYLDERGYKCVEIQPVDMFPHTMHVECCAKIVKKSDL